jgi:hypothetical protein
MGAINQRQYHILGMNAVLVQWEYPGIDELGYKNRVNCLLFKSKWELFKQILWSRCHPKRLQQICDAGHKMAWEHTYDARAKDILKQIHLWLE